MESSKVNIILKALRQLYPNQKTTLLWKNPWELLIATILSAQTTDIQVNKVLPKLLKKWPTPEKLKDANPRELQKIIKSIGLYKSKSNYLIETAQIIHNKFKGEVPNNMKDLLSLKGVSRKTANIVLSLGFGINDGIAVDTHVKRISTRLGLTGHQNPKYIEKDLMKLFPKKVWGEINILMVQFGREICKAQKPRCYECILNSVCSYNLTLNKSTYEENK